MYANVRMAYKHMHLYSNRCQPRAKSAARTANDRYRKRVAGVCVCVCVCVCVWCGQRILALVAPSVHVTSDGLMHVTLMLVIRHLLFVLTLSNARARTPTHAHTYAYACALCLCEQAEEEVQALKATMRRQGVHARAGVTESSSNVAGEGGGGAKSIDLQEKDVALRSLPGSGERRRTEAEVGEEAGNEGLEEDPMMLVDPERVGESVHLRRGARRAAGQGTTYLPLFVLRWQLPLVPGGKFVFNIFEPRYKHMIKLCVDHAAHLVLASPGTDVGTACRVVAQQLRRDGSSIIEVQGEARVTIRRRSMVPRSFGLTLGHCSVLHDVKSGEEGEDEEEETLRALALETLSHLLARRLPDDAVTNRLATLKRMNPQQLSMWLISALRAEHAERHRCVCVCMCFVLFCLFVCCVCIVVYVCGQLDARGK
jgi:Lon protease-like protein